MRLVVLTLAVSIVAPAQSGPAPLTLDRATNLVADYARGMTEVQFDASCTLTHAEENGKPPRLSKATHIMEFVKGRYGADPISDNDWTATMRIFDASSRSVGLEMFTDEVFFLPVAIFPPARRREWNFESDGAKIAFRAVKSCSTFYADQDARFRLNDCGAGEITESSDGAPLHIHFEGIGMPVSSAKEAFNAFRVDGELASVTLQGGGRPFLFPKHALAVYDFSEGKLTVDCRYAMRTKRKR